MKQSYEQHLVVREVFVQPGNEWTRPEGGWSFVHFTSGIGYWLGAGPALDLLMGSVLILAPSVQGSFRASQISPALVHFFTVEPKLLIGVATLGEHRILEQAAEKPELAFRLFAASDPIPERFRQLLHERRNRLRVRLQFLSIFLDSLDQSLDREPVPDALELDARKRLEIYLKTLPEWGLVDLKFSEVAEKARCTPRHLNRVFQKFMGKSFRVKQLEVRLARAKELLATTRCRISKVAAESGYRSPTLFSVMFKNQVGQSPAKWRRLVQKQVAQSPKVLPQTAHTEDRSRGNADNLAEHGATNGNTEPREAALSTAILAASREANRTLGMANRSL